MKKQKDYSRENYLRHRDKYLNSRRERIRLFKEWFEALKDSLSCECGESRSWVLDFHHKDPKVKSNTVSNLVRNCNKDKVLEEINKCVVLCANCHRDLHYKENLK
jgi:hypothetical protein